MSELLNLLAKGFDTKGYPDDKNPKNWRKINGSPVHLDANGNIDGGAGGKFNGAKCTVEKLPSPKKENTAKAPGETLASVAAAFNPKQDLQYQEQNANISTNQGGVLNEVANAFDPIKSVQERISESVNEILQKLKADESPAGKSAYSIVEKCISDNKTRPMFGVQQAYNTLKAKRNLREAMLVLDDFLESTKEQCKDIIEKNIGDIQDRLKDAGYFAKEITPLIENKDFLKENRAVFSNVLSKEEARAVTKGYVANGDSFAINTALRTDSIDELSEKLQKRILLLDSAFEHVPRLPDNTMLHRFDGVGVLISICGEMGINVPGLGKGAENMSPFDLDECFGKIDVAKLDKLISGSTFTLPAYTSTSCAESINVFKFRPVQFHFLAEKGQKCIVTPTVGRKNDAESEVILPRNTKITVDGVCLNNGKIEIYARIVKEE